MITIDKTPNRLQYSLKWGWSFGPFLNEKLLDDPSNVIPYKFPDIIVNEITHISITIFGFSCNFRRGEKSSLHIFNTVEELLDFIYER